MQRFLIQAKEEYYELFLMELAHIAHVLVADAVGHEALLLEDVAAVFLVLKNAPDDGDGPLRAASDGGDGLCFQGVLDHAQAVTAQEAVIDLPHHLRLLRDDPGLAVLALLEGVQPLVLDGGFALPHGLALAPLHVLADGLALPLGHGPQQGEQQLPIGFQGVDVLFLEQDGDAQLPQGPHIVEAVYRIPGEPGDGLHQHQVDLLLPALADHPQKLGPFGGGGTCDALVSEDPSHSPGRIGHDLVGVILLLGLIAGELLLTVGGHPAVGGRPELLRLLVWGGLDYNDIFLFQREAPAGLRLSAHGLHLLLSATNSTTTRPE